MRTGARTHPCGTLLQLVDMGFVDVDSGPWGVYLQGLLLLEIACVRNRLGLGGSPGMQR